MSSRAPASPPELAGFTYKRLLGSGGFADVFLYDQHSPRREVAVKVLLEQAAAGSVRRQFQAEADLMAQVSSHPSIVAILAAEVAPDGRPYLVMEYCSRANLSERYRAERLPLAEVLRIGVRLASAVETAHRSGILHRDIKPANVLTTAYGHPALTDFGISASSAVTEQADDAVGMSVPWSPPELFADDPAGDVRSDVWSLGATVYTLLARRSPFERPGGSNDVTALVARIETEPLRPTGRGDVPASLERVLARSMSKDPTARPQSALELARGFQQVEIELQLSTTAIDVLEVAREDAPAPVDLDLDDGRTRIRGIRTIDPTPVPLPRVEQTRRPAGPGLDGDTVPPPLRPREFVRVPGPQPSVDDTMHRPAAAPPATEELDAAPSRSRLPLVIGAVVLLLVGVAAFAALRAPETKRAPAAVATPDVGAEQDAFGAQVPSPKDVRGIQNGSNYVSFIWDNPDPQEGDRFAWRRIDPGFETQYILTDKVTADIPGSGRMCIEVLLDRSGRQSDAPSRGCSS